MARALSLKSVGIGVGVGVADIVTETVDKQQGLTKPFQNLSDIVRGAVTIGGYGYAAMKSGKMADTLQTAAVAYTPLFIRTIYKVVTGVQLAGMPHGFSVARAGQSYGATIPPAIAPPVNSPSKGYRTFAPVSAPAAPGA